MPKHKNTSWDTSKQRPRHSRDLKHAHISSLWSCSWQSTVRNKDMKISPLSTNVTVTEGTQTSSLSQKGSSIQKWWQLAPRAFYCFFENPRCLSYFQPLNYTSKMQRWPNPTTTNTYYLRVCRKASQHSSHLLSFHSLGSSSAVINRLPRCTDTPYTASPPYENQQC